MSPRMTLPPWSRRSRHRLLDCLLIVPCLPLDLFLLRGAKVDLRFTSAAPVMDDSEPVQSNGNFIVFNEERAFQDSMSAKLKLHLQGIARTNMQANRINIVSISRSGQVNTVIFEVYVTDDDMQASDTVESVLDAYDSALQAVFSDTGRTSTDLVNKLQVIGWGGLNDLTTATY